MDWVTTFCLFDFYRRSYELKFIYLYKILNLSWIHEFFEKKITNWLVFSFKIVKIGAFLGSFINLNEKIETDMNLVIFIAFKADFWSRLTTKQSKYSINFYNEMALNYSANVVCRHQEGKNLFFFVRNPMNGFKNFLLRSVFQNSLKLNENFKNLLF